MKNKTKLLVQGEYAILHDLGPVDISKLLEIPILGNTLVSMKPGLENLKLIYPAIKLHKLLEHNILIADVVWFQENEVVDSKNTVEVEITEIIEILNFILTSFITFNSLTRARMSYKAIIIRVALCNYYLNKLGEDCEENTWKIIRKEAINWFYDMLQNKY